MSSNLSKEEYLKRYLSNDSKKKTKKKRKCPVSQKGTSSSLRIIDDDTDSFKKKSKETVKKKYFKESSDEDAPVIANIIDDRPWEEKKKDLYHIQKWKTLGSDETEQSITNSDEKSQNRMRHDSNSSASSTNSTSNENHSANHQNSENLPPRRSRYDSDSDGSTGRRARFDSDSDQSPARNAHSDSDQSPIRKTQTKSDDDQSPIRQNHQDSDTDQSPVRKYPVRSDSDQSPIRSGFADSDGDLSPPRKPFGNSENLEESKKTKTLAGTKAGLQKADAVRKEIQSMRRREEKLLTLNAEDLGKDSITQFRKTARLKQEEDLEKKRKKEENEALLKEKYSKWNKGLKQTEIQENKLNEALHEMSKPLARYAGDDDLEKELKERENVEDPMFEYMRKKKLKKNNTKGRPAYQGPPPPLTRFNIPPGYRWDGVDRSNGFEKKIVLRQTSIQADKDDAYKWSIEDM